jgi:hypothetical protein
MQILSNFILENLNFCSLIEFSAQKTVFKTLCHSCLSFYNLLFFSFIKLFYVGVPVVRFKFMIFLTKEGPQDKTPVMLQKRWLSKI